MVRTTAFVVVRSSQNCITLQGSHYSQATVGLNVAVNITQCVRDGGLSRKPTSADSITGTSAAPHKGIFGAFHPHWPVPLRGPIDRHRGRAREAPQEAFVSRRRGASGGQKTPSQNIPMAVDPGRSDVKIRFPRTTDRLLAGDVCLGRAPGARAGGPHPGVRRDSQAAARVGLFGARCTGCRGKRRRGHLRPQTEEANREVRMHGDIMWNLRRFFPETSLAPGGYQLPKPHPLTFEWGRLSGTSGNPAR